MKEVLDSEAISYTSKTNWVSVISSIPPLRPWETPNYSDGMSNLKILLTPCNYALTSHRLLRESGVDVSVGPERAHLCVPNKSLSNYLKTARCPFFQHGGDSNFNELEEDALYLPKHAPETVEIVLKIDGRIAGFGGLCCRNWGRFWCIVRLEGRLRRMRSALWRLRGLGR